MVREYDPNNPPPSYDVDPETGEIIPLGISASPEDRGEEETATAANGADAAMEAEIRARIMAEMAAAQTAPAAAADDEAAKAEAEAEAKAKAEAEAKAAAEAKAKAEAEAKAAAEAKVREAVERRVREEMAMAAAQVGAGAAPDAEATSAPAEAAPPADEAPAPRGRGRPRKDATAVAAAKGTALATDGDLSALFEEDAGKGVDFDAQDIAVPRLYLLQDMSPQVKERSPDFIEGARPGMWFNTVTNELLRSVLIIPVKFTRRYVGWRPRADDGSGGGLVRADVPQAEYEAAEEISFGTRGYIDDKGKPVEIVETPEWIALALPSSPDQVPMPVAISFPKTKAKVAGKMNTAITLRTRVRADGSEFTPPAYANVFRLAQKIEGEGANSYFVPTAEFVGEVTKLDLYERARRLFTQFDAGRVVVAEVASSEQV